MEVEVQQPPAEPSRARRLAGLVFEKYYNNSLLVNFAVAILLAFAKPSIGLALRPDITAKWIAVVLIFVMTGLSLKTEALVAAFANLKFNAAVQIFNLGILTILVYYISRLAISLGLNSSLGDGMVICAALPMTVNMVIILTTAAHGDEAAAVFNSAFGNFIGIFITPAWILLLLGSKADIAFLPVVLKLIYRVIVPLAFGQLLQKKAIRVRDFYKLYKARFKKGQEACLSFILYCVFCNTFSNGSEASVASVFIMICLQMVLLLMFKSIAWGYMAVLFPTRRPLRAMGFFGCVQKTVGAYTSTPLLLCYYFCV